MFSIYKFVLCKWDQVGETFIRGDVTYNNGEFEYPQVAYVENGDDDDDIIYDYAPAAWVDLLLSVLDQSVETKIGSYTNLLLRAFYVLVEIILTEFVGHLVFSSTSLWSFS